MKKNQKKKREVRASVGLQRAVVFLEDRSKPHIWLQLNTAGKAELAGCHRRLGWSLKKKRKKVRATLSVARGVVAHRRVGP